MNERIARSSEWNIQGLTKCTSHIVLSCTKGNTNRKLGVLRKIQPASQGNVAIQRFFVLPIETIVVSEVGPAIIHTDVSTRCFCERNGSPNREPCISFVCKKKLVLPICRISPLLCQPPILRWGAQRTYILSLESNSGGASTRTLLRRQF